jgi:hypothetical protein
LRRWYYNQAKREIETVQKAVLTQFIINVLVKFLKKTKRLKFERSILTFFLAPDSSGSPEAIKAIFSRHKRTTRGSSFYALEKKLL